MPKPPRVALSLDLEWPLKRHAEVFAGAQRYAREQGWASIVDEFVDRRLPARRTRSMPYEGVIARATPALVERCHALRLPLVNVWSNLPVADRVHGVFADFAAAGRMQAEHLLDRGLRNFAAIIPHDDAANEGQNAAFREIVERVGFACDICRVPQSFDTYEQWQSLESIVKRAMQAWKPPIGVIVAYDQEGRLFAQWCAERGWRVPGDVAIIAGSNEEIFCEHPSPSLTSVEFGYDRIGYEAARMLDGLMARRSRRRTPEPEHVRLPPVGLVLRESTDFYSIDDPAMTAALEFIATNGHRAIRPADVARAATIALRTLQLHFRRHLGRSISAEIARVRLERAQRELAFSNRPVKTIARDVGFGSAMRMNATFRRELGVSPGEYRAERREP